MRNSFHIRKTLAESFAYRSFGRMPFVIIDATGQPLRDVAGDLIVLAVRDEAVSWATEGERVEPYVPELHDGKGLTEAR